MPSGKIYNCHRDLNARAVSPIVRVALAKGFVVKTISVSFMETKLDLSVRGAQYANWVNMNFKVASISVNLYFAIY